MALENAEAKFDAFAADQPNDSGPDSSELRVRSHLPLESGIPPARVRDPLALAVGVEHMEMALGSAVRAEANLGLLVRGLKHLSAGADAARQANRELSLELDGLRLLVERMAEQEHALSFRLGQLAQLLDVARQEGARERKFLIEQQDLFLIEIMSDHDRQLADLRRSLHGGALRTSEAWQQELDELTAQRDQAREYATRCERERDAAWHELAAGEDTPVPVTIQRSAPPLSSTPRSSAAQPAPASAPPAEEDFSEVSDDELRGSRKSSATAIGSISLRAVQVPASSISSTENARVSSSSAARLLSASDRVVITGYSVSGDDVND